MVAENLQYLRENLANTCVRIGRDPQSVDLIAVSKTFPAERIEEALAAGLTDFGENYVQEMAEKRKQLDGRGIRWHCIGHLQSNKVKYIIDWVHLIHSVDSIALAEEVQKRSLKAGKRTDVLIEVNTSREATKFGVAPADAEELVRRVRAMPDIRVRGLMTIGPFTDDRGRSREAFRTLRTLFDGMNARTEEPMTVLSMGMTHDYTVALEEGATMLRIGTALFGPRSAA